MEQHSFFHRLSNLLWGLLVALMVLLAVYVSFGRMLMSNVGQWQANILQQLNARVPFTIEAREVRGEWRSFSPVLALTGLRLSFPDTAAAPVELAGGALTIDVLNSLRSRSVQFSRLHLDGLSLQGELTDQGQFRVAGFDGGGGAELGPWFEAFLLNIERLSLENNALHVTVPGGARRSLDLDLVLRREGSRRTLEASLLSTLGTTIAVLAEGVGNPFTPESFSGALHLQSGVVDLAALREMFPGLSDRMDAEGAAELQVWLGWERGEPTIEAQLDASALTLVGPGEQWRVPLQELSLAASIIERRNRWTVFLTDLELRKDEVQLHLPRLQLDTWGDSLRLRAQEVDLASANQLFLGLEQAPPVLADVFATLAPRGRLERLQLTVADLTDPVADWEVETNFSALVVDSWRGAPGVESAAGFARIGPQGGFVVLDSQQFSMTFPSVYTEPLRYDDFHGTIDLAWDEDAFYLGSGQIIAQGVEGTASALFGLTVPFTPTEVGLEMELLVGLENTYPIHRSKYLPYILPDTLLGWLRGSIGEGRIEQGAFFWRGSLARGRAPLRTIGLFFNLAETRLEYHPQWPAVSGLTGTVLIDDTDVSVWSERARVFDTEVEHLSAEAWMAPQGEMLLAVDTRVRGSAADGLRAVNESVLADIVGNAFSDWELEGQLQTELKLLLNLNRPADFPDVRVQTLWSGVDVGITPLDLTLEGVNGNLDYSSSEGFSSDGLDGTLWGRPLETRLRQQHVAEGGYDPASSSLTVQLQSQQEMADLRAWLELEQLGFASGEAAVDIDIEIVPGQMPRAWARSDLVGVSLDLPDPWRKPADQSRELRLALPLAGEEKLLRVSLDDELHLDLRLGAEGFGGAGLGFRYPPAQVPTGAVFLSGHAPLVDQQQWLDFVEKYIAGEALAGEGGGLLPITVDELLADTWSAWGQDLRDVVVSVDNADGRWELSAETDWLQARMAMNGELSAGSLDVDFLEMDQLGQFKLPEGEAARVPELPSLSVTLSDLQRGGVPLGKLSFQLASDENALSASGINGELAGLAVTAEQPAELVWRQLEESTETSLVAELRFDDLGKTLERLGYARILETESGRFDLTLNWPGGPHDFSLARGEGSLVVDVERGSFLETPAGATGTLKVVSILNLADLVGRLSLTQMFDSGIPFRTVDGEVFLHGGSIEVAALEVKGSSSAFQLTGVSEVATRSMDGELVVTLPVANNLPWVAALTAGLPVAAGVFVVSKVFEKQFNRFSSGVYKISGPWDDPDVEFDRIFDTDSQVLSEASSRGPSQPAPEHETLPSGTPDPNQVASQRDRIDFPAPAPDPNAVAADVDAPPADAPADHSPSDSSARTFR